MSERTEEYRAPVLVEGDILNHYEVGKRLALGGQGKVHEGREKATGRQVVIKRYNEDDGEQIKNWDSILEAEEGAAREMGFLRQANANSVEGLPLLLAAGTTGPFQDPVSIFEPISGETIRQRVESRNYNPSIDEVKKVLQLLRNPIHYAHTFGVHPVVHRDIKPVNAMINGNGAKLIDWAFSTRTSGKTKYRTQLVPDGFVSPEIEAGEEFDGRADVYSLGRVIQYMLLGADLFEASDGKPSTADFERLNIPQGLVGVLKKATEEPPSKRFNTSLDFYNAAERAINGNLPIEIK